MEFNWPPLESNPEIFTNYMHKIGLPADWAIGEVFGFDEELLAFLPQPVIGVIVNIERLKKEEDTALGSPDNLQHVNFYMKQTGTLDNACGIIACIHAALNNTGKFQVADDTVLGKFSEACKEKTPEERATALENNEEFKEEHK